MSRETEPSDGREPTTPTGDHQTAPPAGTDPAAGDPPAAATEPATDPATAGPAEAAGPDRVTVPAEPADVTGPVAGSTEVTESLGETGPVAGEPAEATEPLVAGPARPEDEPEDDVPPGYPTDAATTSFAAADESPTTNLGADAPPTGQFGANPPPTGHPGADAPPAGQFGGGTPPPPPPPGGSGAGWADEPPPITGFARRHQLIRPVQGKKVAGVCAGLGRATGTDPVLWRVVLTVLVFFGGVGLLAYVVGWLCMPRDDDQAAPVESLVGRGRSATSPAVTVLLGIAGIALVFFVFNSGFRAMVLVMGVALVVAVVLTRRNQTRSTDDAAAPPGTGSVPGTGAPGASAPDGAGRPSPDPAMAAAATAAAPTAGYRVTPPNPMAPHYTVPPTAAQQPGYRPPFAPHGPYGPGTASPLGAGEVPIGGMLPPPPPPQYRAKPPKPPKQKSILGRLTFFVLCLAIGALAVLAAAGLHVPVSAFFALGLVVLGGGLVFGAWRGRARWLIILGCVFALALPVAWFSENAQWDAPPQSREFSPGDHVWAPQDVRSLRPEYNGSVGDSTLDLSNVDFTGQHEMVSVHNSVGDVKVLLPPNVDVTVTLEPGLGDATLFGQSVESPHNKTQERTDLGPDGRGGGTLELQIKDNAGDVEVTR
ncbi:PspC domain-containing protein [Actinocatenispora comari]|uniref:Phage shock protein C (PspC) family protein n=1 Tax=Actinocatenispora comari TaxID=2807577 RepID=A0A8J4ABE0_9ACTN|nr:PspC domain-containing protein [Actinocatenispora comari]GIL27585.1 hypothetical protein NUM_28390 [Actinocatenispora comari]